MELIIHIVVAARCWSGEPRGRWLLWVSDSQDLLRCKLILRDASMRVCFCESAQGWDVTAHTSPTAVTSTGCLTSRNSHEEQSLNTATQTLDNICLFAFLTCPHIQARPGIPRWAARTCPAAWSPCWARGSPAGSWTEGSSCPDCCQASCDHQLSFRLDPWEHQKPAKEIFD